MDLGHQGHDSTTKHTPETELLASESGHSNRISVFEVRGEYFEGD